ncbi:MAG TPA: ABC transporter ATP-binding protein [Solirubrobacterales bacterium]|jgi:lipooligosaccharide transport system ATP-binding protein|nr:ABC transporter ATP-binding protein [Solirubrobacterales bacterium]
MEVASPKHAEPDGASANAAVSARGVTKRFGERTAVAGIDFEVEPGICFGFLGPNGAGKTTTMKMIYGLATVDSGVLTVLGMDARRERRQIKSRLGVVPQETNLDADLTVRENLLQQARYFGIDSAKAEERAAELLEFSLLADRGDERIHGLSGGMKRRLLISRALMGDPELVVLDEPTTGLDPQARLAVWGALDRLRRRGVTLLLTTHYMEEAERLCDRLVIMDEGRIVAEGRPADLVRAHVGREVLELKLDEGCDAERLVASLDGKIQGHDRSERTLMLYADDAEAVLEQLDHDSYPTESALVRRATLEDVFLRLTGRSLRE